MKDTFNPLPLQGGGFSMLARAVSRAGYNPGLQCEIGRVTKLDPLTFTFDSDGLDIDEYHINADLLPKTETVIIDGVPRVLEYPNEIEIGEKFLIIINEDDIEGEAFVVMKVDV